MSSIEDGWAIYVPIKLTCFARDLGVNRSYDDANESISFEEWA